MRVRHVFAIIAAVIAALVVSLFFIALWWRHQPISAEECAVLIRHGNSIARAIDQSNRDRGQLPDTLKKLTPTYIKDLLPPRTRWFSKGEWKFVRKSSEEYLLVMTALHGISSYDALVYSSTGTVPSEWRTKAATYEYDGWYHFIGAQNIHDLLISER